MTAWPLGTVAVTGGTPLALGLAMALSARAVPVTLIADDAHDASRARDVLGRVGADLAVRVGMPAAADVILACGGDGGEIAPGRLHISVGVPSPVGPGLAAIALAAPPPNVGLVEILHGSDPRVTALITALGARALWVPQFITPRLIAAIEDAAEALIFSGATPWEVDAAAETAGFSPGPCAAQDARGLDGASRRPGAHPLITRMVAEGRLGRAAGVGWYRYPGGGGRVIDPLIEDLAREEARFAGLTPRPIGATEIRHNLAAALVHATRGIDANPSAIAALTRAACTGDPGGWTPDQSGATLPPNPHCTALPLGRAPAPETRT